MKCYIINYHNKYLRADLDKKVNDTTNKGDWEIWTLERQDTHIYIKSHHGAYLRADQNRMVGLTQNKREWERWTIERQDNHIYIMSHHGTYLRADLDGTINLTLNKGVWERWKINAPELVYTKKMYTILEPKFLRKFIDNNIDSKKYNSIAKLFNVKKVYNPCDKRNALTCSFYGKNFNIDTYKNSPWDKKYFSQFKKFIKDYNKSNLFNTFKIRIYLENQLECFIEELLALSSHVEIYHMEHNTDNNSQPGMLWRFLAFSDKSLDIAYCTDIDLDFNDHILNRQHLQLFIKYNKTMGRILSVYKDFETLSDLQNNSNNYAVVLASSIGIRPKRLDLDIKSSLIDYILYRDYRLTVYNSKEELDGYNTEPYSSWASGWKGYGFDEKFLKHTLFPYLVKKGEVLTSYWVDISNIKCDYPVDIACPVKTDIGFCKIYGNRFINMHTKQLI